MTVTVEELSDGVASALDEALRAAKTGGHGHLPDPVDEALQTLGKHQESAKSMVAVILTMLAIKYCKPDHDCRNHRKSMGKEDAGVSGRSIDTKVTTPWLRGQEFPAPSESGWLTRSFEQDLPYNRDYPGKMKPEAARMAFLEVLNSVEEDHSLKPMTCMVRLIESLVGAREERQNLTLTCPVEISASQAVEALKQHYKGPGKGRDRLPVLALHAVMSAVCVEVSKYKGHSVLELRAQNAPDAGTGHIGDIEIAGPCGWIIEGMDIKHEVEVGIEMVTRAYDKVKHLPIERYSILTTADDADPFLEKAREIKRDHGCEMIVNGVEKTLTYYLRLLSQPKDVVAAYLESLKKEVGIEYELKKAWNDVIGKAKQCKP